MPSTESKPAGRKLNTRVHDFFQKFRRDKGPVKVAPRAHEAEAGDAGDNIPAANAAGSGRDVSIAQLKQGYGEVLDTMQSVRRHLDDQAQRSDRMIHLLEGLPEVLRSLPEQNKTQTEMLRAISDNMARQTETTGQLSSAITSLSTVGENQQKTMNDLQDHLRAEDVARRELREGIGTLDETLGQVRESSESSRATLETITHQAKQRDDAIGEMFRRSQKTTSAMMAVSWALAIVALAVSAYVAVQVTQQTGRPAAHNASPAATAGVTAPAPSPAAPAADATADANASASDSAPAPDPATPPITPEAVAPDASAADAEAAATLDALQAEIDDVLADAPPADADAPAEAVASDGADAAEAIDPADEAEGDTADPTDNPAMGG